MSLKDLNFQSMPQSFRDLELKVHGEIPSWLIGSLYRNGPGKYEQGQSKFKHWFDGYAILHRFNIREGKVTYTNKLQETEDYLRDKKRGMTGHQWGSVEDPCASVFHKFFSAFFPVYNTNTNVSIARLGNEYVSMSDYSNMNGFDPETLECKGKIRFEDKYDGEFMVSAAHPAFDAQSGAIYNALIKIRPKTELMFYRMDKDSPKDRKVFAKLSLKSPVYFHSIGITDNYLVFVEMPMPMAVFRLLFSRLNNKPYNECFDWKEEKPCIFHVVKKDTGEVISIPTESFFVFHHVNAFEEDGLLRIDLCRYDDPSIIKGLYLKELEEKGIDAEGISRLHRYTIDPQKKTISDKQLSEAPIELPQINSRRNAQKNYRYVYGIGAGSQDTGDFFNCLQKIDISNGTYISWRQENAYPSEPLFIASPDAKSEDEGLLLSVVFDAAKQHSFLLILNASNMQELAKADVPASIPYGLHGTFYNSK